MSRPPRLDLLIPGLFGPVPVPPGEVPPTPVLSRLLGRADRLQVPDWSLARGPAPKAELSHAKALPPVVDRPAGADRLPGTGTADPCRTLFHLFGYAPALERDCPSAPYCWLADRQTDDPGMVPDTYVLHADPVHLRPDRDRLVLFAGPDFAPDRAEADALVALFNQHLGEEGLRLEAPTPGRWYLLSEQAPELVTQPLAAVLGRPIAGQLPRGPEARRWARLLNEVQMLFHHSEVNQHREAAGIPTLNGLWLWGGGRLLPPPPGQVGYARVFSSDPLARGLARACGIPTPPLPTDLGEVLAEAGPAVYAFAPTQTPGLFLLPIQTPNQPTPTETRTSTPVSPAAILIHWTGLWEAVLAADGPAWLASLTALEQWLAGSGGPAGKGGATGRVSPILSLNLDLYPANGERFHFRAHHRYRFWRNPLTLILPDKGFRESP